MAELLSPSALENYLHREIPLTRLMEVRVARLDREMLALTAPLSVNHNHLGTAFGGSINSLATLAGYAYIWSALGDPSCHVVIRQSSIRFDRPVRGDLTAICRRPSEALWERFARDFSRKQKARLELQVAIEGEQGTAVTFEGIFVALK